MSEDEYLDALVDAENRSYWLGWAVGFAMAVVVCSAVWCVVELLCD